MPSHLLPSFLEPVDNLLGPAAYALLTFRYYAKIVLATTLFGPARTRLAQ